MSDEKNQTKKLIEAVSNKEERAVVRLFIMDPEI